jgi:hypothetical protein
MGKDGADTVLVMQEAEGRLHKCATKDMLHLVPECTAGRITRIKLRGTGLRVTCRYMSPMTSTALALGLKRHFAIST